MTLPIPDGLVLRNKKHAAQLGRIVQATRLLLDERPDHFLPLVQRVAPAIYNRIDWDPPNEAEGGKTGYATALGFALDEVERQMGWQQPDLIDGRVHTFMVMSLTSVPPELKHIAFLMLFCMQGAYWVARTDDLDALLNAEGIDTIRPDR